MNDPHDNAADDKAMLTRIKEMGRAAWDQHAEAKQAAIDAVYGEKIPGPSGTLNRVNPKTGRLFTRADIDQWSALDAWALEAGLFEPSDQQVIDWNEASDYLDDAPHPE